MSDLSLWSEEVKKKLEHAHAVSILTHLNPDADTLGTGLGIYVLLRKAGFKRVEIVNASKTLPKYLDFLPSYQKIKHKMDFEESLVISCDCGSVERLGFDVSKRDIVNIDHHLSNENYGSLNVVISEYASASQVAFALFKLLYPIEKEAASCFYAALLSDTQYFTTSSVTEEVFEAAKELISLGANPSDIAYHFTQKKSLSSLRILQKALRHLSLTSDAQVATLYVTEEEIEAAGATMPDIEGIVDYAQALATVEIAVFLVQMKDTLRVSFRSKSVDVSSLAKHFGGGGHKVAAGFSTKQTDLYETIDIILKIIQDTGLLYDTK